MASSHFSDFKSFPEYEHDVYLSGFFHQRVLSSRKLCTALRRKRIKTFCGDQPTEGDEISASAIHAIKTSKISVVNFSESYASSGRCLDELSMIVECKNKYGQKVIPIFNGVDQSDVTNLTGAFGDAFSKLEERFKDNKEKLQKWKSALMEAGSLHGFDSHSTRSESELIQQIVEEILKILKANKFPSDVSKDMVGIDVQIPHPTPPPRPPIDYDAYLSVSIEDTRKNFISDLYTTMRKQIKTCIDDQKFIEGDKISRSVVNAIQGSKAAVVILSKGYASSARCLDELVKIIECKNKYGLIVIPVFNRVHLSNVRNQTGDFGNEFLKLEERFKENVQKVKNWRSALKEVADLPGLDSYAIRPEALLVEKVVEYVLRRLNDKFPRDLVGLESWFEDIEPKLINGTVGVDILGIWGISGTGKTTIANVILNNISSRYDGCYFVQNVGEKLENTEGLLNLRQNLVSMLFEDGNLNIGINPERERLSHKKVVVVLDDVTCLEKKESLMTILDWFMPESLVIITTRNEQVLRNGEVQKTHEMKRLVDAYARKLFSWHAFGKDHPDVNYEELSRQVRQYAQGIPLALKVLGRFLSERSIVEWERAINKLERLPDRDIQKVLRVCYDGLDDKEKNIFLKIVCFHIGEDRNRAIELLDLASGSSAEDAISVLIEKHLITISDDNKIAMHNLLQEMGREIACNLLGKHSRFRHLEDNTFDSRKKFAITSFFLESFSSGFDQGSSVDKPQYALLSMLFSFVAVFVCILEFIHKGRKGKVTWKWRGTSSWFYYPSGKRFGNSRDIIGLLFAIWQCSLTTTSFCFFNRHAQNPIKLSALPIIFQFVLLCRAFFKKKEEKDA